MSVEYPPNATPSIRSVVLVVGCGLWQRRGNHRTASDGQAAL